MSERLFQYPGKWIAMPEIAGIAYIEPHLRHENELISKEHFKFMIGMDEFEKLRAFMVEHGYVTPQFSENRTEDIKIIHRLIDVIEHASSATG